MKYAFPRYLMAKQTVDDRALNPRVFEALRRSLPADRPLRVVEAGAGIGSMLRRLIAWGLLERAEYLAVDESSENMAYARRWLPDWTREAGVRIEEAGGGFTLTGPGRDVRLRLVLENVFNFVRSGPPSADLLIAHAFLDLLPLPASLKPLFSLLKPGGLAWLTLNFDGATIFEPVIDPTFDALVEELYHASMDARLSGGQPSGDSRAGRHLFTYLREAGAEILEAGASDWVVFPRGGRYPAEEAHFLHFILHFFEESLRNHPALDEGHFATWLQSRRAQVERGELVYLAHQIDFLVRIGG
jgi:SAM-dependent methyltransferase